MAEDNTFKVGDDTYAVGHMDPRVQLFVVKRLMRFLPAVTGSEKVLDRIRAGESVQPEDVFDVVAVLAPIVADTPDDDLNFISDACLRVTSQRGDTRWYPVQEKESGTVMNRTNDAVVRKLLIVANVLRVVLAPMWAELAPNLASLPGGPEQAAA